MTALVPEVHPRLAALPLLDGADYDALVEDIRHNGLLHSIVLDPVDQILDGRSRMLACADAKIKPTYTTYHGPAEEYIVGANLHRRHLTPGQKAMFGVALKQAIAARDGKPVGGRGVTSQPPENGGEVSDRHARGRAARPASRSASPEGALSLPSESSETPPTSRPRSEPAT